SRHRLGNSGLSLGQFGEHVPWSVDSARFAGAAPTFEERVGLDRGSKIERDPAMAEYHGQVEFLVLLASRLVNRCDDRLSVVLGETREQIDEGGRVVGSQPARRFVEEEQHRIGDELHGDVHALALATTEDFGLGSANLKMCHGLEAELSEGRLHSPIDLFVAVVRREAKARAVAYGL